MSQNLHLEVSIDEQTLRVLRDTEIIGTYSISTGAKGVGFRAGSFRTPTGRFLIADKIGAGAPAGTIFTAREPNGIWTPSSPPVEEDLVLTRILRLQGIDPENLNTYDRFIYIHGTNREDRIGAPASHGCIRMHNSDVIELFDLIPEGTPLHITPPVRQRGKIAFLDCDSTLSTIEGIDELARTCGGDVFREVVRLTDAAMNGEIPLDQVFSVRMEAIRPGREVCEAVAARYVETITPGAREMVAGLKAAGWTPVILSGGFAPLIEPLAREMGIDHVEAVPLYLNPDGTYSGYGQDYPTTRNGGKSEIIREWKAAMLPSRTIMIGDGISDLETKADVDVFIGYGGVASRPPVREGADLWLEQMSDFETDKI